MSVTLRVKRLPHGDGLPLPSYQSTHAAGLDVVAGVPETAPVELAPGARALDSNGLRAGNSGRLRGASPPALGAWRSSTA